MPASSGPGSPGRCRASTVQAQWGQDAFLSPPGEDMESDTWHLLLSLHGLSTNKKIYRLPIYPGSQGQSTAAQPESGAEMLLLKEFLFGTWRALLP